jgi:hypothetical protein
MKISKLRLRRRLKWLLLMIMRGVRYLGDRDGFIEDMDMRRENALRRNYDLS